MKRKLFLLLYALLLGISNASADVMLETDMTAQFNSLATTKWSGSSGQVGWAAPQVTTNSGLTVAAWERYEGNCYWTGDIMHTTVTGLAAGTYKIELFGAAAFTFGRGFGSQAFTGAENVDVSSTYTENQSITENTGVLLYATTSEGDFEDEIPIWYATNFNTSGIATVSLNGVVVGENGQITIGMKKTSSSTNWHVVQLKGVTATVSGDAAIAALKATANGLLNNATYVNVTGTERTNLQAAYDATPAAETQEAYKAVISALNNAISAFENCDYTAYDKFVAEKTKATALGVDVSGYSATDAADAVTKTQSIMVDEYAHVTTNYEYGVDLGEWTKDNAIDRNGQHWDGTPSSKYSEQNEGWGASTWDCSYNQDITLPAGKYVFKVAGRKSSDAAVLTLKVTKGNEVIGTVNDFPNGDTGFGINTSGATDFSSSSTYAKKDDENTGRGWQWRYVPFTLADPATVNVSVTGHGNALYQWVGFCNPTVQTNEEATQKLIAYNIALSEAEKAIANAAYNNVIGSERTALQAAIDADASLDKSDADAIEAATTALDNARVAFTNAKTSYDTYVAAKAVEYVDNLPYASSAKFAAIGTAQAAGDATSASDAEAKTNAIISAYRLYVESNALAEGVGGIDKTNLISDANFSEVTIDGQKAGAWAFSQTGGTAAILNGESFTDGDGNANYSYFDYNNNGGNNQNLSQTLTDLPKGQYLLTVTARATTAMAGNYYLSVDFDETSAREAIPAIGNTGGTFGRGWNDVSLVFNHVSDGDVTIHVYGENGKNGWSGATRFRLAQIGVVATIGATGWTTFASTYPLDLSNMTVSTGDVKAYYASSVGTGKIVMTSTTSEGVAAGTGLMLKGTAGATVTIPVAASGDAISGNMLVGCTTETPVDASASCYVLINNGGTAEFQSLKDNGATIPAGKAYLSTGVSSPARLIISFDEEDPTAINAIEAVESNDGALKDGKYLIGNKVVLVKNGVKYGANGQKLN